MRLHRKGQRMLGAGRVQAQCYHGPLDGETVWVPEGTKEFFAVEQTEVALTPDALLPSIWKYSSGPPCGAIRMFSGRPHTPS